MYLIIFHNNVASLVLVLEHLIELYSYHELINLTGQFLMTVESSLNEGNGQVRC